MVGTKLSELVFELVSVAAYYRQIAELMKALHENERLLYSKTADWNEVEAAYMDHIREMEEQNSGICYVAWWRDTMVGFIFGYIEEEDNSRIEEVSGHIAYISDGFVRAEWRGKGIYRKLNQLLEDRYVSNGIRRFTRFTLCNNEPMKHFLQQAGYVPTRLLYEKWL